MPLPPSFMSGGLKTQSSVMTQAPLVHLSDVRCRWRAHSCAKRSLALLLLLALAQ